MLIILCKEDRSEGHLLFFSLESSSKHQASLSPWGLTEMYRCCGQPPTAAVTEARAVPPGPRGICL